MITVLCLRQCFGCGGGPEQLIHSIARHRDRHRYRFIVVLWLNGTQAEAFRQQLERQSVEVVCLHTHRFNPWIVVQLMRLLQKYQAQIIHTHDPYSDIAGLAAGKLTGCRTICSSHGFLKGSWKTRLYEAVDRMAMRGFDRVVAGSEAMVRTLVQAGVRREKLSLVYNGIEIIDADNSAQGDFRAVFSVPPHSALIGVVGRLSPEKGHAVLLQAFAIVARTLPNARLAIVGDGPERARLQVLVQTLALEDKVLFTGYYEDLPGFLTCCDLFVLPSLRESLPLVLLEAMAAGVAAVASDVGGVSELLSHGQSGLLVRQGDPRALAEAIQSLVDNTPQAKRMGQQARQRVMKHFNAVTMVEAIETLYAQCLSNPDAHGICLERFPS